MATCLSLGPFIRFPLPLPLLISILILFLHLNIFRIFMRCTFPLYTSLIPFLPASKQSVWSVCQQEVGSVNLFCHCSTKLNTSVTFQFVIWPVSFSCCNLEYEYSGAKFCVISPLSFHVDASSTYDFGVPAWLKLGKFSMARSSPCSCIISYLDDRYFTEWVSRKIGNNKNILALLYKSWFKPPLLTQIFNTF